LVLLSEVVPLVIPVEELNRLSSSEGILLEAISEVLGISLSEVLNLYFGDTDKVRRGCLIEEAMYCWCEEQQWEEGKRIADEMEQCLVLQSYREDAMF
jgi:hypothetical protein